MYTIHDAHFIAINSFPDCVTINSNTSTNSAANIFTINKSKCPTYINKQSAHCFSYARSHASNNSIPDCVTINSNTSTNSAANIFTINKSKCPTYINKQSAHCFSYARSHASTNKITIPIPDICTNNLS